MRRAIFIALGLLVSLFLAGTAQAAVIGPEPTAARPAMYN